MARDQLSVPCKCTLLGLTITAFSGKRSAAAIDLSHQALVQVIEQGERNKETISFPLRSSYAC